MKYEPVKHHRHSLRLKNFDYAQTGAYFVTVVTQHRICLFGDIINSEAQLSAAGTMVQAVWSELPIHYSGIKTDVFVVMPNHFHGIIFLVGATPRGCPSPGQAQGPAPTAMSLPDVLHRFKTLTTKKYTDGVKQSDWAPFAGRFWQRNYYEHVIRDEESLNRIREYILNNPAQWAYDPENPAASAAEPPDLWRLQERREGEGDRPVAPTKEFVLESTRTVRAEVYEEVTATSKQSPPDQRLRLRRISPSAEDQPQAEVISKKPGRII